MPLTTLQNKRLQELTVKAFNLDELTLTLSLDMGLKSDELVDIAKPLTIVVMSLCDALERRGQLGDFISVVIAARPHKAEIQAECPAMLTTLGFKPLSTADAAQDLTKDLTQVQNLLGQAPVRAEAEKAKGMLTGLAESITKLEVYKSLHDQLHVLQGNTGSLELAVADLAHGLADSVKIIRDTVSECQPFVARLPALVMPTEQLWLTTLENAAKRLERADTRYHAPAADAAALAAARAAAATTAANALTEIRSVLISNPARIDALIREAAGGLKLDGLGGLFRVVEFGSSPESGAKQQMATAEVNAGRVEGALKSLVNRHVGWQTVMVLIGPARETLASIAPVIVPPGADESDIFTAKDDTLTAAKANFDTAWQSIDTLVTQLQAIAPDAERSKTAAAALASMKHARKEEIWATAEEAAAICGQICGEEFLVADGDLKAAAKEVAAVGASISTLLNSL